MAFSSSNPYQYLAVYFDFFAGPVRNSVFKYVPNNQYIYTHSRLLLNDKQAMQWHSHPQIHINI